MDDERMDSPETWRWVWTAAVVVFGVGEMATPGAFVLAPFALGALVAAVIAFADGAVALQWAAFVVVSAGTFAALRPVVARLDRQEPTPGIGSRRLIGRRATVLEAIPAGHNELGIVRIDREEWRAESADGTPVAVGTLVQVVDVSGTRVVVQSQQELP